MSFIDDIKKVYAIGKIKREKSEKKEEAKKRKCEEVGMRLLHRTIRRRIEEMIPELRAKIEKAANRGFSSIEFSSRYYDFSTDTLEQSKKYPRLRWEARWSKLLNKSYLRPLDWTGSERVRMFAVILAETFKQEGFMAYVEQRDEKDIDGREYWPWVVVVSWE